MMVALASACNVLVGSDRNTGPQGGVVANFTARRTVSGIVAVDCAFQYHLVMGWVISSTCSVSWVNSRPSASWPTEATATMSGMLSFQLLTIWVMALGNIPLIVAVRSEEHTSELQSPDHLLCRLL